uniref:Uncharacterized protein n=1 Tax=Rhizophora mucronata TaxID=61149 RepID=A0A2P2PBS1_RHIMU
MMWTSFHKITEI